MQRDRWQQLITVAVAVSLVLALVAVGLGVDALHKSKSATAGGAGRPVATMVAPRSGAVVSGTVPLAAVSVSSKVVAVDFLATGGQLHNTKVATAQLTFVGWAAAWDSTSVANGTYQLVSVGYSSTGRSARGPSVLIKVMNF